MADMPNLGKKIIELKNRFTAAVLETDLGTMGRFRRSGVRLLRVLHGVLRSLVDEQLMLWTMSLVYTTVLSLIPLLAVSFSLLKAFDLEARMESILMAAFAPLGPAGTEIAVRIAWAVEQLEVGLLGTIGFIFLFYKSIFLIYKMERALNYIWRVESTRNLMRRFGDYILILLVGPVLIFTAIGITFTLVSTTLVQWLLTIRLLGPLIYAGGELISYLIVSLVFTFVYILLPDAKVRFRSALLGGAFAGVMWEVAKWAFAAFTVTSAEYSLVYSGFAVPVLFLLWLYVSWFVLLVGGQVAFLHQNPDLVAAGRDKLPPGCRLDERLFLAIMFFIGHHFHHRKQPWNLDQLATRLRAPPEPVREALARLEQRGVIRATGNDPPVYLPTGDLRKIELKEILETARARAGRFEPAGFALHLTPEVQAVIDRLEQAFLRSVENQTLEDMILARERSEHG